MPGPSQDGGSIVNDSATLPPCPSTRTSCEPAQQSQRPKQTSAEGSSRVLCLIINRAGPNEARRNRFCALFGMLPNAKCDSFLSGSLFSRCSLAVLWEQFSCFEARCLGSLLFSPIPFRAELNSFSGCRSSCSGSIFGGMLAWRNEEERSKQKVVLFSCFKFGAGIRLADCVGKSILQMS